MYSSTIDINNVKEPQFDSENATLLSIKDVARLFGVSPVTASKIISESGGEINLHRKKYVLSDVLYDYLRTIEGGQDNAI